MAATIYPEGSLAPAPVVTATHTSSQYSKQTFLALESYCVSASRWRVVTVLVVAPLPGLIASLLPSIVHLNDPRSGLRNNSSALLHAYLLTVIVSFGTITQLLGATEVPDSLYSQWEVGLVSALGSAFDIGLVYSVCHYWRFPVPFFILIIVPFWITCLGVAHVLVLRRKLWQSNVIIPAFKRYSSASNVQNIQFFVYAGLTIVFDRLGPTLQLVLVVAFPAVKYFLKVVLRYSTKKFSDLSGEVAVSTVEICATLYQALIMQSSPSIWAIIVLILLDVIQSLISIKIFVDQKSDTPRQQLVRDALSILHQRKCPVSSCQPLNSSSTPQELVVGPPMLPTGLTQPIHEPMVRQAPKWCFSSSITRSSSQSSTLYSSHQHTQPPPQDTTPSSQCSTTIPTQFTLRSNRSCSIRFFKVSRSW